jgi:hypothetical protein
VAGACAKMPSMRSARFDKAGQEPDCRGPARALWNGRLPRPAGKCLHDIKPELI